MPDNEPADAEARRLLEEIKQLKNQAEEQLRAAEAARKKADEDATYAYQAKMNCEGHAKATAMFKGTAEADINAVATHRKNFESLVASVTVGKASIEAEVKSLAEARKSAEQTVAEIINASEAGQAQLEGIQTSKDAVDAASKEVNQARDAANLARDKTNAASTQTLEAQKQAQASLVKITETTTAVTGQVAEIAAALEEAKTERQSLDEVVAHLTKADEIAVKHETRVAELAKKLESLTVHAEGLLPGFTGTGLAHSFNAQKGRFADPQKQWLRTFRWCIAGLVVVAAPSFFLAVFGTWLGLHSESSWEELLRNMVMRLPIVIPLVWLAIYAGRNYMLSVRLEEDYAYKEAISRAFEGYKREMEKIIAGDADNPTPLMKLCTNVLSAISERPGRIYDSKQEDINLLTEVRNAAEKLDEIRRRQVATS